jgi:hypothetical protein
MSLLLPLRMQKRINPNPELNHHGPLGKPGNPKSQVLAETHPPSFKLCGGQCFVFL